MPQTIHLHLSTLQAPSAKNVEQAFSLAKQLGARVDVSVLAVETPQFVYYPSPYAAAAIADLVEDVFKQADDLASLAVRTAEAAGVEATIFKQSVRGRGLERAPALVARTCDFSITPLRPGEGDSLKEAEQLTFDAGRGVLVLPEAHEGDIALGRVLVAWDHSEASARAVAFAAGLLKHAEAIDVVTIDSDRLPTAAEANARAVAHLQGHGLPVTGKVIEASDKKAGARLAELAQTGAYDLVVMGAYNTPRAQEILFGGATRTMLRSTTRPLFLAN